jgi:hypothetical protein
MKRILTVVVAAVVGLIMPFLARGIGKPLPSAGKEFLIDTNFVCTPSPGSERLPCTAFDGTNYLVVWSSNGVYGAQVDTSGVILDRSWILISSDPGVPSLCFDGVNYFVVWTDDPNLYRNSNVCGARVSPSGNVLDTSGITISTTTSRRGYPSVAFDGTNYLVVWQERRNGTDWDIYGARVTQDGAVLDSSAIAISTAGRAEFAPSIVFDGTNYLVVWQDGRNRNWDIYGARVTSSGTVLEPEGIPISILGMHEERPSVAFGGTTHFVVWESGRSDIRGTRIDTCGVVLDTSGIIISTAANEQTAPFVIFNGSNYLVIWQDNRSGTGDIYGTQVNTSGIVLSPSGIAISTTGCHKAFPSVASDGSNCLVTWEDDRNYPRTYCDIYGTRTDTSGIPLDSEIVISTTANYQKSPALASNGIHYLVVWEDYRNNQYYSDIYGTRVDSSGSVSDPEEIVISTATDSQALPAIVSDGVNYLVVWQDNRSGRDWDVHGRLVNSAGTVLDSEIVVSTAVCSQESPSIAFDGVNYMTVWEDWLKYDISGTRIDASGVVSDSGIDVSSAYYWEECPSIASGSGNYFVVWGDNRNYNPDVYGARVDSSGVVLDPSGIAISAVADTQYFPAMAFDGTNYLVVWQDRRSGTDWDIYGARVNRDGVVLDANAIVISDEENPQKYPSVVFDGMNYLVVWQDLRNKDWDIYGTCVDTSGVVFGCHGVSTQSGDQLAPAALRGIGSQILVVYSGWTPPPYNAMRIWGRSYPFAGVEEGSNDQLAMSNRQLSILPNPFIYSTIIEYYVPVKTNISLEIHDITGRTVMTLVNEEKEPGIHRVRWDVGGAHSQDGCPTRRTSATGVYFVKLRVGGHESCQKIILLK